MLLVRVGEVEFRGHTDAGFLIGPDGFKGWEGAPATKRSREDRSSAHGSYVVPAWKSSRLVTLAGTALGSSEAEVEHLRDVLSGLGKRATRLTVQTAAGARWVDGASVEGPIVFERVGGADVAEFEFSLLLPDPFKYGEARAFTSTGTDVQLWHRGNTDAWPVVTVTGSFPNGYRIVHQNGSFRVTSALGSGQTDVIDFRRGVVSRNGVVQQGVVMAADRKSVPGGGVAPMRVEAVTSGSGTAVFSVPDTFL